MGVKLTPCFPKSRMYNKNSKEPKMERFFFLAFHNLLVYLVRDLHRDAGL